jgi:CheY-like chemotaxis protein
VTADALRELGYAIIQAEGPSEAIQQLTLRPNVALILTDIIMPRDE